MYLPGIEILTPDTLRYERIGLLSHQAATVTSGESSAVWLRRKLGKRLVALFAPEHGFFGLCGAGEHSPFRIHPEWNIPVWSLYGEHREPTEEMLKGLDLLIVDLQDIGVRCYTYLATLQLTLRAASKANIPVMVCDRPQPFACGDGPGLSPDCQSFVAPIDLPMVYALTQGESARYIQKAESLSVNLTVLSASSQLPVGTFPSTLDFVPPSPAIRTWASAQLFPLTVFTEALPAVDCDRNGAMAFRVLSLEGVSSRAVATALDAYPLDGIAYTPYRYASEGRECDGLRFCVTDPLRYRPITASIYLLSALTAIRPDIWTSNGARPEWFDKLYGTKTIRPALLNRVPPQEIVSQWSPAL